MTNYEDQTPDNLQQEAAGHPGGESGCGGAVKEQDKPLKSKCLHSCSNCQQKMKAQENAG
ncbi:hypothetical protein [Paenibacillus nasutitermitis]|uniref:Uncharacterized protein n=1 Tax=Paenibacillus nasutitermitis TaxID=1652958 RepID=A0A916YPF2_9BACL|nr:hypothetical protein [Paenibacillus nasutitermitis]GGD55438.1 hypothetical protein GCM10010911_11400 [Paenibacillus nasutitermitis]